MRLGVIGYGLRMKEVIRHIKLLDPAVRIAGIVDVLEFPDLVDEDGLPIPNFPTVSKMLAAQKLDGIMIGTRCSEHTAYALEVLPYGIPLYLEKPVSTSMEQWKELHKAAEIYSHTPVVVSHPLRLTSIVQKVKAIVESGEIGEIAHVQATNNVPYGGVYYHAWYRDESITGGMFLQKATHDFDYLMHIIGSRPIRVCAVTSKLVFKGQKPAGLRCKDCEDNRTCEESTVGTNEEQNWPYCCFAEDTGNEDSGSALIEYENGVHLSYTQNFIVRREAGTRGARVVGYKGTVDFDFITGSITVIHHHKEQVDRYQFGEGDGHFGGDAHLAANFIAVMKGKEASISTLQEGLRSALLCLKAKEAAVTKSYQEVVE
ncbi:oxidoreductase [Paenibacillus sp. MY03]|uniref:Gfo/Idh/MocA family protein n=1 Tax=Paenibacillus sp. MY03 TaxID=302980 RepID=UPI000B3BF695|nr:Gfo/Idh/MocA family oxidoreductase [Paenibacillus sp. MY03]OUS76668.1 oxidoreductase [Paenibacillus sp. MY03]